MRINVNGEWREVTVSDTKHSLLWALREELGLTGAKYGCGQGVCGACTVHIGGKATRACQVDVREIGEAPVVTIEGLGQAGLHPAQQAWIDLAVPQCGYCQPGQIMQAAALLTENRAPDDAAIDRAMANNICRCGTYPRIRAAIKKAAEASR